MRLKKRLILKSQEGQYDYKEGPVSSTGGTATGSVGAEPAPRIRDPELLL
jgi:hypothetical protein